MHMKSTIQQLLHPHHNLKLAPFRNIFQQYQLLHLPRDSATHVPPKRVKKERKKGENEVVVGWKILYLEVDNGFTSLLGRRRLRRRCTTNNEASIMVLGGVLVEVRGELEGEFRSYEHGSIVRLKRKIERNSNLAWSCELGL
ncbi:unnamed protein product [Vicia faba]|uniref:Uncharacterized protein n=1 Tax=Vicia faba TaxID=3906 RepID=A0AAV0ZP24_VICFA|nr:unnamed protein product [Vicia faba]